jgi:CBS domain-containing protein
LVVLNEAGEPIGIVTDRDLALRALARGVNPADTKLGEVMSRTVRVVREDESIEAALAVMRSGPFRRLPVVGDDRKLVGLLSLDDILDLLAEEFSDIGMLMRREGPSVLTEH